MRRRWGFWRRDDGGIAGSLDEHEDELLRQVFAQLLELLEPDGAAASAAAAAETDPLAAALGIGTATAPPDDPALARLFPAAYRDDDEAAADFRRYTEPALRAGKVAALRTALGTLSGPDVTLDEEQAGAWLRALNDSRLVLAERLGVSEDAEEYVERLLEQLAPDDPVLVMYSVYARLGHLEETLVEALAEGL